VHLDFFITISFSTPHFKIQRRRMLKKAVSKAAADGSTGGVASGLR